MTWFRDLKLRSKLLLAFGSVIVVMCIGTAATLSAIVDMQESFTGQERSDRLEQLGITAVNSIAAARAAATTYLLTGDPGSLADFELAREELESTLDELRAISGDDPAIVPSWDSLDRDLTQLDDEVIQPGLALREALEPGTPPTAEIVALASSDATVELQDQLAANLGTILEQISSEDLAATRSTSDTALDVARGAVVAALLVIAMCLFWALVVARILAEPLHRLAEAFRRLGDGDLLREPLGISGSDEVGQLGIAFDATIDTLGLAGSQAQAVGQGRVNDSVLDQSLPGDLGRSFDEMVSYLREIATVAETLSQGDLTRDVRLRSETDSLGWALRRMTISLRSTVENVRLVTLKVRNGATALAEGAEGSAGLASEVAGTVLSIRAALAEQTRATNDVATAIAGIRDGVVAADEAVARAVAAAGHAGDLGREGELRMAALGDAMGRIDTWNQHAVTRYEALDAASHRVEEMVDLIHDVAEQTKVLALNAAIEAARAGEAGRGFSVVAAEVKDLSDQTAESSKQVATIVEEMRTLLVEASQAMAAGRRDVERGTTAVATSEETFAAIAESVRDVASRLDEADAASGAIREQSGTIDERTTQLVTIAGRNNSSVSHVADATTRTATTAEEIGTTATELATSGEQLTAAVSRFRLGPRVPDAGTADPAPPVAPPPEVSRV